MDFIDLKTQYQDLKSDIDGRIAAVLEHGQYIMGPEVAELETELARYVGCEHAVAVASGTDALMIAMMALGIGPGDEVITTPFTFISTGEVIALLGATPVFVDIDPLSFNISPAGIEASITNRTRAIMPVSLYGQCADFDAINTIAARHELPVIEDGAQSFGATYKGRRSCGLTTIGCTSFFPSKPLGAYGDAGACFTADAELAAAMREIRVHGQSRRYYHPRIGLNGRIDTLQAAILLAKLAAFPDEVQSRGRIGARYTSLIEPIEGATPPILAPHNTSVYAQYTVRVANRDSVQAKLRENGIPTAVHYPTPLHEQPAFKAIDLPLHDLTHSLQASREVISLPMHPYLDEATQDQVVAGLQDALARSD